MNRDVNAPDGTRGIAALPASGARGKSAEDLLLGFAHLLRAAGLRITVDRTQTFVRAVACLGMDQRVSVYWAGRSTLCQSPDDLVTYDSAFRAWFMDAQRRGPELVPSWPARTETASALADDRGAETDGDPLAPTASSADVLRRRDVAELSSAERDAIDRLIGGLVVRVPTRRSRRRKRTSRGDIDAPRTTREYFRRVGEPGPLKYRNRPGRPRRIVFLADVSGSMAPYADSLLRLAHRIVQASPRNTEVFSMGTRLTRLTSALRKPSAGRALAEAGEKVPDWAGGTRLGEMLRAFIELWGRREVARGAVVVIASDGWERGDAALLGNQMQRLRRLAYRVVWVNPHLAKTGYLPVQGGILAALPHVDDFAAGHSMQAFVELMEVIANA
jgi:uncharacterized protein with von Willebrand factor type A (vWA) domain